MGLSPVLTVDGKKISQTPAIGNFLATEHGLAGADRWEAAKALELSAGILVDGIDAIKPYAFARFVQQTDAEALWPGIKDGKLKKFMEIYEKFLEANGGEWFVGKQVTWTDFVVAEFFDRLESKIDGTLLDQSPKLRDHYKRVHALPKLKKYLDSRPETPF